MSSLWMLTPIGILVISFLTGFLFFYANSPLDKERKKQHMDEGLSMLINVVLFIWLGKIVLNLPTFLQDPLAILAYPSDAASLYFAILFGSITAIIKIARGKHTVDVYLFSFVTICITASFTYEFIQIVWNQSSFSWEYLGLLVLLLLAIVLLQGKLSNELLGAMVLLIWSIGQLGLAFYLPFTTIFGYMLSPWFLIMMVVVSSGLILFYLKERNV